MSLGQTVKALCVFYRALPSNVSPPGTLGDDLLGPPCQRLEVKRLHAPSTAEIANEILAWQPHILYLAAESLDQAHGKGERGHAGRLGGIDGIDLAVILQGPPINCLYLDAPGCADNLTEAVQSGSVKTLIHWQSPTVTSCTASVFARAFFAALRDPLSTPLEAYYCARETAQAHTSIQSTAACVYPQLTSTSKGSLPDMQSIPAPDIPGAHVTESGVVGLKSWEDIRLLAPYAEVKLSVCGQANLISQNRLGALGLAMRALLVREVRTAKLLGFRKVTNLPKHLKPGLTAVQCQTVTANGVKLEVVLAGPEPAILDENVIRLALRHTFTADALSLQMRLPAKGAAPQQPATSPKVAHGCPVMELTAITSVWVTSLLHGLCQDAKYRGFVATGVAAVGRCPTAAFSEADSALFSALLPPPHGALPPVHPPVFRPSAPAGPLNGAQHADSLDLAFHDDEADEDYGARKRRKRQKSHLGKEEDAQWGKPSKKHESVPLPTLHHKPYTCKRAPLQFCSEQDWLADYCEYSSSISGRRLTPDNWPDCVLNGETLDIFNLYKEVALRGGFGMGNGINWKGQIFPKMRNFSLGHKMTGIGNSLKTKYQHYLLDYERAHTEDVTTDRCVVCAGGEEVSTDWVSCDRCDKWVHFSCDDRPGLGTFKDYAKTDGLSYICGTCASGAT